MPKKSYKKSEGITKSESSSNSLKDDDAGTPPQSLFVVVNYFATTPASLSILRLDTQGNNHDEPASPPLTPKIRRRPSFSSFTSQLNHQKEYVAHFSRPRGPVTLSWLFSPLTTSSTPTSPEGLCMMPYWDRDPDDDVLSNVWDSHRDPVDDVLLNGCKFDFKTKMCKPIMHKGVNEPFGHIVNMSGCIYNLSHCFARYDPRNDSWTKLQPFPVGHCPNGFVKATAVWDDTILFNMGASQIWAYYSPINKWYHVDVKGIKCYNIVGEAVVLGDTIYALSRLSSNVVLALSITRTGIVDFKFECSLREEIFVEGMMGVSFGKGAYAITHHLVHLGKDNFCLVTSCLLQSRYLYDCRQQPIHLTNIKLKEEDSKVTMTVTDERQHMLRVVDDFQFRVVYCFSVPDRNTIALKEGKSLVFDMDPFPEDFDPERKQKFDTNVQRKYYPFPAKSNLASKPSTTLGDGADEEGHSVYVRDIPHTATFRQVEMELKKQFGPIKRNGIEVIINLDGRVYAVVDFKSPISKERAIEASCIMIDGHEAVIEEKK